jgi:hypothetical protein
VLRYENELTYSATAVAGPFRIVSGHGFSLAEAQYCSVRPPRRWLGALIWYSAKRKGIFVTQH